MPRNTHHQYACSICSLLKILFFKFSSSAWREHEVYRVIQWCFAKSSRAQCVFLHSGSRVFGPKTEHESFFGSLISCMRLAIFRETKKARPLLRVKSTINLFQFQSECAVLRTARVYVRTRCADTWRGWTMCTSLCSNTNLIDWLIELGFNVTFFKQNCNSSLTQSNTTLFRYTWINTLVLLVHKNHNKFVYVLILLFLWSSLLDSFLHLLTLLSSEFSQLHSLEKIKNTTHVHVRKKENKNETQKKNIHTPTCRSFELLFYTKQFCKDSTPISTSPAVSFSLSLKSHSLSDDMFT